MKRITVEEVLAAYKATGLKPKRGGVLGDDYCCGLGVLYASRVGPRLKAGEIYRWADGAFGSTYTDGFMFGFDSYERRKPEVAKPSEWLDGMSDGLACAAAVFGGEP